MTYDPKNLSVLAYANGFTLWHYRTTSPMSVVTQTNAFDAARDVLRGGDIILVNSSSATGQSAMIALVESSDRLGVRMSSLGGPSR